MIGALCSAKLRNGDPCRSVATDNRFCAYHTVLAAELGWDTVTNGGQTKRRNARQREPVIAESEPLELPSRSPGSPSAVRPALALTAAEKVETIRRVLLEAATSSARETWATCTCPQCGKGFRQELALVIAMSCANEIRAVVDQGDEALRLELERWEPNTRETLARALAEVA